MSNQENQKLSDAKASAAKTGKRKWSIRKKIAVIASVIVVVFVILVLAVNSATSAPLKVSNQLIADIKAKNSTAAYELFSTDAKKVVGQSEFAEVVDRIGPILTGEPKVTDKQIAGETGKAATSKIEYEIKGNDGVTYLFVVNLTKDNGQWKVLNFDNSAKN